MGPVRANLLAFVAIVGITACGLVWFALLTVMV